MCWGIGLPQVLHGKLQPFFFPAMQLLKSTFKKKSWDHNLIFYNSHQTLVYIHIFYGNYFRSDTTKKNFLPCYWIYCYCLRIMKLQINQGDTYRPVVSTNKDPVTDMIHKIEISGEPVNRHLLHIWKTTHTKSLNYRCKSSIISQRVHKSVQSITEDISKA